VVLVTGASKGIGAAIAELIGQCGGKVALHANSNLSSAEQIARKIGNDSSAVQADLNDANATSKLYDQVFERYGRLDVLVNNAGVAISSQLEVSNERWVEDWLNTMNVNLLAAAILCKRAITDFQKQGSGIIVNISSRAARRGDTSDYLAYAASKGGLEAITKSIARAYGKKGITAFGVAPGFTRTNMAQDFIKAYGEDYVLNDLSLPELTEPKDIAQTVVFLASGLARHATGTTIDVNAGSYVR
ncbi:MAG: SDR family oxidoreductase, partial [Bacteroidota bacterium]